MIALSRYNALFFTDVKEFAMIKNWKAALAALVLSVPAFGAGAAFTAAAHAQTIETYAAVRSDRGSDRSIRFVNARLEDLIEQLQRDRRDYGGHRVAAIENMEQARAQLVAALQDDRGR
jgi:hypothetical protein